MTISAANGSMLYIGTTQAAENLSQFLNDSYTEIGETEDLGEFGDTSEIVTFVSLADGRVRKLKGSRDAGDMAVIVGHDISDAGQDALVTAEASTLNFNFKVVLNDALTLGGTGTEYYFRGKVANKRISVGSANNVVRRNFTIAVDSAIEEIQAT